jgi:hypothetical protein
MTASLQMTHAKNLGRINTLGAFQGQIVLDATIKSKLESGVNADSKPMWAGIAVSLKLNDSLGDGVGAKIIHATSEATVDGFVCTAGSWNGITDPSSKAPLWLSGDTLTFFRVGSGAQIYVPLAKSFGDALSSANLISVDCSIDFTTSSATYMHITAGNGGSGLVKILGFYDGISNRSQTISVDLAAKTANWVDGYLALIEI